jgi:endonuclease/exonuclease/phosphatase family metal-dependent hydrolase
MNRYRTLTILALACLSSSHATEPARDADTLRVMVWNTERGSNPYGRDGRQRVLRWIRETAPDVVLWQESYKLEGEQVTLGHWVAGELGWNAWQGKSPHLCIVTPYEMVETHSHQPWHGVGAQLRDPQGRTFVAWSIWLDSREYLPWAAIDDPGISNEELLKHDAEKSSRLRQARDLVKQLETLGHLALEMPLLVGGDWNCPSHLDWTAATWKAFPHRRPLPLPVSTLIHEKGLVDTFRVVHPDPVAMPGNTWSPLHGKRESGEPDPPERIDRLYLKNTAKGPQLKPERALTLPKDWSEAKLPRESSPFPSDHAAVVMDLKWDKQGTRPAVSR